MKKDVCHAYESTGIPALPTEEAEEHVIEPRRGQLGHHRLREGVVGRLEEPEDDVVRPELPDVVEAAGR